MQTRPAKTPEPITVEADDKARRAEEILFQQGDMHSHYDIGPWQGGFAVFRTYQIDDAMLGEYGLQTGQQVLGRAETLDQIYDSIIDAKALSEHPDALIRRGFGEVLCLAGETAYAEWVTDERMEREAAAAAETEAAYTRACGEAYHHHGFSFRDREQTNPGTGLLVNSLTLPEPQNGVERRALNRYLDAWEERIGCRPEVIFEVVQKQEAETVPPVGEHSRWTGEPLGTTAGLAQNAGISQSH
jgi:hypothetical protein